MAFHLMATVKDSYDAAFKLMSKKHATHIEPISHTSLDTASHTYSRTMEVAYYISIIERNDLKDFFQILSVLELKTKKILGDEWQEYRQYQRDWNDKYREMFKDHPEYYK